MIRALESVQSDSRSDGKQVSFADLVVLGGAAAVEKAARTRGHDVTVPFTPGRSDATQEKTDVDSFSYLEPKSDGFRNLAARTTGCPASTCCRPGQPARPAAPEMTVLVGGLRVLGANTGGSTAGVLTDRPGR